MLYSKGNTLLKLKSEKQLLIIFAILAIIASSTVYFFSVKNILPYNFEIIEKISRRNSKDYYLLRDYQNNGVLFKFNFIQHPTHGYYYIQVGKPDNKVLHQYNFRGTTSPYLISFHDWNQDAIEELYIFTSKMDTIFLSILDINNKTKYLDEQPIISGSFDNKVKWNIRNTTTKLIDVNGDDNLDLVFGIMSGLTKYPRGVFTYDISKKKLSNKYLFNAGFNDLNIWDINNDGNDEIIVTTSASGNIGKNDKLNKLYQYSDFYSWLLIFNKNLKLKYPAENFTTYPSSIYANLHIDKKGKKQLMINTGGKQDKSAGIYLFNNDFNSKKHNPIKNIHSIFNISVENNYLAIKTYNNEIKILNHDFEIIKEIKKSNIINYLGNVYFEDHLTAFVFSTSDGFINVLNPNFELLAKFGTNEKIFANDRFLKSNSFINNGNEINFHTDKNFYQLKLVKSNISTLLPYLSVASAFLLFFLFIYTNKFSQMSIRRFKAYGFLINQSNKAVVILNKDGKIKSYNDYFVEMVSNRAFLKKNEYYEHFLTDMPELKKFIETSIELRKENKKEISIKIKKDLKSIVVTVFPIISFWGFPNSYIIELDDITNPIMDERQKIWAQTSQKIAHDIKTPLSTIQLNIKALNQRIDKDNLKQKDEYKDDLEMISSEVGRIRDLTQSFLQFASIEKPKLESINVKDLIERSLLQFRTFFNNGIKLETSFQNINENVYADFSQLEKLFHILIENAIDSMNGEGIIEIKTLVKRESYLNSLVDIEITDHGKGIPQSELDKIFDPYFTTKKHGNGLGLAIAKKIVEDNNGEINVYSKEGLGTTITISFALVE